MAAAGSAAVMRVGIRGTVVMASLFDQSSTSLAIMGWGAELESDGLIDFGSVPSIGAPTTGGEGLTPLLGGGSSGGLTFGDLQPIAFEPIVPPGGDSGSPLPGGSLGLQFTPLEFGGGLGDGGLGGGSLFDNPFGPLQDDDDGSDGDGDGGSGGGGGGSGGGGGGSGGGGGGSGGGDGGSGGGGGDLDLTLADGANIQVFGDSFVIVERGFPQAVDRVIDGPGYDIRASEFARSGDTAEEALARFAAAVANPANPLPDMALIHLGTNDALQGIAPGTTKAALDDLIDLYTDRGIEVLLAVPEPFYPLRPDDEPKGFATPGEQNAFRQIYEELAAENEGVILARNIHDGLDNPANLEDDRFHPNFQGTELMAQNIKPELDQLVEAYVADLAAAVA